MKVAEFFGRFVFTRKCPSCGELLPYERSKEAFCEECRAKWDIEKTSECEACRRAVCECVCMPKKLSKSGALCLHKVVKYSLSTPVVHNTVMFLKRNKNPRVADFLASQMLSVINADEDLPALSPENAIITFVPRSRKSVTRYGTDQCVLLSSALSARSGIPCFATVKRKRGGTEQKTLSAEQRIDNVRHMFEPITNIEDVVSGKRVILIDDVVTTGASMAACVRCLVKLGAREIICLSIASTYKPK